MSLRSECSEANQKAKVSSYKILVTHPEVPEKALKLMSSVAEVVVCQGLPPHRSEILEKCKGVHGLFWACSEPLNVEVLDAVGPQLKSVSTMSAGIETVDVGELQRRRIPLGHTPDVLNNAVSDIAVGLMIAAARRFHEGRLKIDSSKWENYHHQWMLGAEISGATVGFFGFGGIGQTIAKRLGGFDVDHILYTKRQRIDEAIEQDLNAKMTPFDEMLAQSDFVFIAAPLTEQTEGVFDAAAFAKMKESAVLINVARGQIVNHDHLYDALKSNKIFAAGLDVMHPEPFPAGHKLLTLPNCVVTPHLGSATLQARNDMAIIAAHNVLKGLTGEKMFAPAY